MRRLPALAIILPLLAGCSSSGTSDYSQFYRALRQSAAASFGDGRITKGQAAAIPYASMGYRVNGATEQLVVLATDANGEQLWTSSARIVITTRGGRIIRTVGLERDIAGLVPKIGEQMPEIAAALKGDLTYARVQDFPALPAYAVTVNCTLSHKGAQTIVILGRGIATMRIDEVCRSTNPRWSFTNTYWIDPDTGLSWRSRQHIDPQGGMIETEILRPPE
ncbi:MAG: YjbF family lipoprotein [Alphaproteobacteria bacterium]|nr:YjbF family lipoprotein [Alphaproteobacteria bacterium]